MMSRLLLLRFNCLFSSLTHLSLPDRVFAVVDMYGKCAQISLMDNTVQEARILSNDLSNEATAAASCHNNINLISSNSTYNNITNTNIAAMSSLTQSASSSTGVITSTSGSKQFNR